MKIAIFGGSFNPVHNEHVNIVQAARRQLGLDKIIIMPSGVTPNKTGRLFVSGEDRLNMCRLCFNGAETEVSDYELTRGGVSYSYLTCRYLKQKYPSDELYFIIGADMLENFPKWKNPEEILKCVTLAVCARKNEEGLDRAEQAFKARFGKDIVKINYVGADVSSTKIRALAALGESVQEYVPVSVAYYIKNNLLYRIDGIDGVKKYLTPERWAHTLGVVKMSAENCSRFGIPENKAITAAALHDCAKYLKYGCDELLGFVCPADVPAPVVHQYAGAYVARHTFGITDEEILDAIMYHTSGKENMSPLGKLLFLCDMLEEGRNFNGIEKLRELFSHSLDEALYSALKHQIEYIKNSGKRVYPLTQSAINYLQGKNDGQ